MFGELVGVRISVGHLQGPREHTLLSTSVDKGKLFPRVVVSVHILASSLRVPFASLPRRCLELSVFKMLQADTCGIITHCGLNFLFP